MIERRLENLLALDYPGDRLEIVVASDASSDRTNELVEAVAAREPRVRLLDCPRGGKVAAQDRAVRETSSEVVAFSDANATWAPDALRHLVASLADPEVAYVCGRLRLEDAAGSNREGLYWRYELWLREQESRLGSITGGNGSIYALNRGDYVEVDPRWGHDLAFPYRMVQAGRRAVYEPAALAFERPTPTNEAEYARKVRMFEHCWEITLRGAMLRRLPPGYLVSVISHRLLRYGSGVLHLALLGTSLAARADRLAVRARPSRPARRARRASPPASRSRGTTSTSRGRPSRRSGTTSAAGFRPPGRPRRGRAEPLDRRRARGARARRREPAAGRRRARGEARGRRTGAVPPDARRQGRRGLRAAEAPLHGRRRRAPRRRVRGRPRRRAHHARRAGDPRGRRSTSCRSSGTSSAGTCP